MRVLLLCLGLTACSFEPLYVGADPSSGEASVDAAAPRDAADTSARDAGFDASSSACRPGWYVATMEGNYRAGAAGVSGVVGPLLQEWANFELGGVMQFELRANGRLNVLEIAEACMRMATLDGGIADNTGGSFSGSFDCLTGQLDAVLRGYYKSPSLDTLGTTEITTFFRGPLTASYLPSRQAFVDGTWAVREPAVLLGDAPGGEGSWSAQLAGDASLPLAGDDCWRGVSFDDSKFGDAGASALD